MIWPLKPLQMFKYGGLILDPPWPNKMYSEKGYEKSPEAHYDTMSLEEIKALPVNELAARDCLLFLWSTAPHLALAIDVMRAWNFTYKTFIAWHKKTVHGKDAFGTGYIVRSTAEICLVGTIGNPPINRKVSARQRNLIQTCDIADCLPKIVEAVTREHSRKPDEFRALMERYLPDQFLAECFAREPWPGHDVWGNETEKFAKGVRRQLKVDLNDNPGSTPKRNICLLMEYDFCLRIWWAGSRALSRSDAQHP